MGLGNIFNDMMEEKLLAVRTAFIGRIEAVHDGKARVQPLSMIKQYGDAAMQAAVVDDVPIPPSLYKIKLTEFNAALDPALNGDHPAHVHGGHVTLVPIAAGDIVLCLVVDRDISETMNGSMAVPIAGHHDIKDAVIVQILSSWPTT